MSNVWDMPKGPLTCAAGMPYPRAALTWLVTFRIGDGVPDR